MKVKLLRASSKAPVRGSDQAAGWDLYADVNKVKTILPKQSLLVPTGIAVELEEGTAGLIWARSKLGAKNNIQVQAGVVDSDYRGEVMVSLYNAGNQSFRVCPGNRIAQMLVQKIDQSELEIVENEELTATARGAEGINSVDMRVTDTKGNVTIESVPVEVRDPEDGIQGEDGNATVEHELDLDKKEEDTGDVPPNGAIDDEAPPMSHGDMGDITDQENR